MSEGTDQKRQQPIEALLIAGPTASGKSALALNLARALNGAVINADSMQVYSDLRIITARPSADEEQAAPHLLYGHRDASENCSVGMWLDDAQAALATARMQGRLPIVTGGTGLYFKALVEGLSAIPPVPEDVRQAVRAALEAEGVEALHARLAARDPAGAARLQRRDRVRIARALEVVEATGRSILDWQSEQGTPLLDPARIVCVFLAPERETLYARINTRFEAMLEAGALDEVRALAARDLDPLLPAMKAHGVPGLIRHLRGEISLAEAAEGACADTRHYAKRQFTWFRHQLPGFEWIAPQAAEDHLRDAWQDRRD